jgi:mono/diheme cytochrome c family protein
MISKSLAFFVLAGFVLAACGSSAPYQALSDAPAQSKTQFDTFCARCHGSDGTGSASAPSILGHDAEEIMSQVRNPEGNMPAFSSTLLSDSDLELLVQYALSLDAGREEAHADFMPGDEEKAHLMAAYEAINDSETMDSQVALNHLQQAMALATDEAITVYDEIIELIESGDTHNVSHELEELLGMGED